MTKFIVRGDLPKEPALKIERQLILSPGTWKNVPITAEAIKKGIENTDWTNPENLSIIYGHRDHNDYQYLGDPSPEEWLGNISVPEYLTLADGVAIEGMYADFRFYDENLSRKIAYGGVRCGVSAGMEYDYRNHVIKSFNRQSIVKNPACKKAFLNLSDEDSIMDTMEPKFLTLEDDTQSIERGTDNKSKMDEDKIKNLEDENKVLGEKIAQLEKDNADATEAKAKEEAADILAKAKEEEATKAKTQEPKTEDKKTEDTTQVDKKPDPIVIEKETIKEVSDNKEVVKAINEMSNKFSEDVKKLATPATAAGTNPNAIESSEDTTTNELVERYLDLHPEQKQ